MIALRWPRVLDACGIDAALRRRFGWRSLVVALAMIPGACRCAPPPTPPIDLTWARPVSSDVKSGFARVSSDVALIQTFPPACLELRRTAFEEGILEQVAELQEIDTGHVLLLDRQAWTLLEAGRFEEALAAYEHVIQRTGGAASVWGPAWIGVARAQTAMGRPEDAMSSIVAAQEALEALRKSPWASDGEQPARVGRIWTWMGVVVGWDESGLSPSPLPTGEPIDWNDNPPLFRENIEPRIRAWMDLEAYRVAAGADDVSSDRIAELRALLERHPDHRPTRMALAEVYLKLGRSREACVLLDAMASSRDVPTHPEFQLLRIRASIERASMLAAAEPEQAWELVSTGRRNLQEYVDESPGWRRRQLPFESTQIDTRLLEAYIFAIEGRIRAGGGGSDAGARSPRLDLLAARDLLTPVLGSEAAAVSASARDCLDTSLMVQVLDEVDRLEKALAESEGSA